jgi:putative restriction endonuclease
VRETYRVEVRRDRLDHVDSAPTVKMLLDFDGKTIWLPKDEALRPAPGVLKKKIDFAA